MSYHDMSAKDVEREDIAHGEDIDIEDEIIYAEFFGSDFDDVGGRCEVIHVCVNGTYNTYSEEFTHDCFTFEYDVNKVTEDEAMERTGYHICESLEEALKLITNSKKYIDWDNRDPQQLAEKMAEIWTGISKTMKTWKPYL